MKHYEITGGGGIRIHAVETGNPSGRPILFIHGYSQCWLSWSRQLDSDLARDYRLVAMDMRGHGLSDKPRDGYADAKLWADDVAAVIGSLSLDRPVLSGWSYGPLVILDYIRRYGDEVLGGIQFVGGVSRLGNERALAALTPAFLELVPGFFSSDVEESTRSLEVLLRLCLVSEPTHEERFLMLGYSLSVPPWVRKALFSRSIDNDDLLAKIRRPVLVTHGDADAVVKPKVVEEHRKLLPHAQIHMVRNVSHAPFWDEAPDFNRRLHAFVESL